MRVTTTLRVHVGARIRVKVSVKVSVRVAPYLVPLWVANIKARVLGLGLA